MTPIPPIPDVEAAPNDDLIFNAMRGLSREAQASLTKTVWKDGIDLEEVNAGARRFVAQITEPYRVRIAKLTAALSDPAVVHTNILRGTIALTKAQAIHIAGLPADIEERLANAEAENTRLKAKIEPRKQKCTCGPKQEHNCLIHGIS